MARPRTALQASRKTVERSSYAECPLSDPDLPIVSETEHKVGHCFCHHCTCGLHCCPKESNGRMSTPWKTQYRQEFREKKVPIDSPFLPQEYKSFMKCSSQNNLKSISQTDFNSKEIVKNEGFQPVVSQKNLKFSGRSSYKRDFVGWQQEQVTLKSPQFPYRGYMVKPWNSESSYKSSFKQLDRRGTKNSVLPNHSSVKSLVNPSSEGTFTTTSKEFFKADRGLGAATPDLGKIQNNREVLSLLNPKSTYRSAYSSDFSSKPIRKTLSRLR